MGRLSLGGDMGGDPRAALDNRLYQSEPGLVVREFIGVMLFAGCPKFMRGRGLRAAKYDLRCSTRCAESTAQKIKTVKTNCVHLRDATPTPSEPIKGVHRARRNTSRVQRDLQ